MAIVQAPPAQLCSTTLADIQPGRYVCKDVHAAGQDAVRLKRLGVCQGRTIELMGRGDPMILKIGASRVGLSRQLAKLVLVDPASVSPLNPESAPVSLPASAV
ncbi:ferrous iron transport protein A [Stieleria sp. ICT_E10.1]|uniref:FeoA family protein n=1 Tax=Stieleria sedimenti TaxID=2976331 RepID=UPI00217FACD1|nr:FeoA family protein [Stieleria sedimenti]MCS7470723.1 ferrous iron transport protein A [Stieleria sedimenti]